MDVYFVFSEISPVKWSPRSCVAHSSHLLRGVRSKCQRRWKRGLKRGQKHGPKPGRKLGLKRKSRHDRKRRFGLLSSGEQKIKRCATYKYLGDGKDKENITDRRKKINASTISINTIAANEVLNKIETPVLLELHEKISVPSLLNNTEAWNLTVTEHKEIEQIEIGAIKSLFNLPLKTPTPAIVYMFGLLYTDVRIHKKQLFCIPHPQSR